jgi:hypothetical protein
MNMDVISPFTSYRILTWMCRSCTKHNFGDVTLMFAWMLYHFLVWEKKAVPVCHHHLKPFFIIVDLIHHVLEYHLVQ